MTTPTKTKRTKDEPLIDSLPTNPFAFEVLDLVSKQRSNAKKVEVLKKYAMSIQEALTLKKISHKSN